MKKTFSVVLIFIIMMMLAACSSKTNLPKHLSKEGIAPYELSESESYILQSFGMDKNSQMFSFKAPKEVISLKVNVYRLESSENWVEIGGGAISIGSDRTSTDQLAGAFTVQLEENYAIDFNINCNGLASYKTEGISVDSEIITSEKGFLQEFQSIEINTEIPVALMVYDSGTVMRSYSLQDYFEPSKFEGMDLVQVVTLKFSD